MAEGPRDVSCQLKSIQLPRNTAETTCTRSPERIEVMQLEAYRRAMCNKHVRSTMTRSSRFHCRIGVINKPTTSVDITCIPTTCCVSFKSTMLKLLTWPWPRPLREHSLITRLRPHMTDPCTKFKVSSISCGDITRGVKFENWSPDPDHAPFREDFSSAGWNLLWQINVPNLKYLGSRVTKLWMSVQIAEMGWFGVVTGHPRSRAMPPFDRARTTCCEPKDLEVVIKTADYRSEYPIIY